MERETTKDKAREYRSTSILLIIVGVVGAVLNVMSLMEKIRLPFGKTIMSFITMSILFIAFITLGLMSLQSAKRLDTLGNQQEAWETKLKEFCKENLTKEKIDAYELAMEDTDIYKDTKKLAKLQATNDFTGENDANEDDSEQMDTDTDQENDIYAKILFEHANDVIPDESAKMQTGKEDIAGKEDEEYQYFIRIEKMKAIIREGMETVDESVLDECVEELYEQYYES